MNSDESPAFAPYFGALPTTDRPATIPPSPSDAHAQQGRSAVFDLSGKVALVTGGSQGLGKAMARGLVEAGADVVIASRRDAELKAALAEILQGTKRKGAYFVADLSKRSAAAKLAADALGAFGRIDILVNNAGTNKPQPIDAIDDETWDMVLELNLSSVMALTRAVVPDMK